MAALYTLIVDTNLYSGNFEREMCAFITGQIGECEVGMGEASEAEDELSPEVLSWFAKNIQLRGEKGEEYPCMRPCTIAATPGRVVNGRGEYSDGDSYAQACGQPVYESVGIFFSVKPPAAIVRIAKERAQLFADNYPDTMTIVNVRLTEGVRQIVPINIDIDTLQ